MTSALQTLKEVRKTGGRKAKVLFGGFMTVEKAIQKVTEAMIREGFIEKKKRKKKQ